MSAGCCYEISLDDIPGEDLSENVNDGSWSCPRKTEGETDYCLFHLPIDVQQKLNITEDTVRKNLLDELEKRTMTDLRLIGARLGNVDLSHAAIDVGGNISVDLRKASISGKVDFSFASVRQPILLDGANIMGDLDFSEATITQSVSMRDTMIMGNARIVDSTIERDVTFSGSEFWGDASFRRTLFSGDVDFYNVRFNKKADFEDFSCMGDCNFQMASFLRAVFR